MSSFLKIFPKTVKAYEDLPEKARKIVDEKEFANLYSKKGEEFHLNLGDLKPAESAPPPKSFEPPPLPKEPDQTTPPKVEVVEGGADQSSPDVVTRADFDDLKAVVQNFGEMLKSNNKDMGSFKAATVNRELMSRLDILKEKLEPTAYELLVAHNIGEGARNKWEVGPNGVPIVRKPHGLEKVDGSESGLTIDQYFDSLGQYPNRLFVQTGEGSGEGVSFAPNITKSELAKTEGAKAEFMANRSVEEYNALPD